MNRLIWLAMPTLLAGCVMGPRHVVPDTPLPASLPAPVAAETLTRDWRAWWQQFNDPVLDHLVGSATRANLDLLQQAARVRAARAQLGFERFQQWPRLDLEGGAAREKTPASSFGFDGASSRWTRTSWRSSRRTSSSRRMGGVRLALQRDSDELRVQEQP